MSTTTVDLPESTLLVYGLGITNTAVTRWLVGSGRRVVLADDGPAQQLERIGAELGVAATVHAPDAATLAKLLAEVDAVIPAPVLADHHPVIIAAEGSGAPLLSEFDLAASADARPVVAITGTNGKTTVTTLVASMLESSGRPTAAVGNLDTPLIAALEDPRPEVFVVEASSFRLGRSRSFRPSVGTWLNFAEDHLDVHRDLEHYRAAKARIWAEQRAGDVAVANADDPVVRASALGLDGPELRWFAADPTAGGLQIGYHVRDGQLIAHGEAVVAIEELWSQLPHDQLNALAAIATATAAGANTEGVRDALRAFDGLAHRVQLVAEAGGIRWFDDSKATAPHATIAAVEGFDSVVLVAGGRNKGMDLGVLSTLAPRVRAVVGIGESAHEVIEALSTRPGTVATSMAEAVSIASRAARPGDVVLLSPACASFDWYSSYGERGEDFAAEVLAQLPGDRA